MAQKTKSSKQDRNRPWCKAYRADSRRERSTVRKLLRRLEGVHGLTDGKAVERLRELAQFAAKGDAKRVDAVIASFNSDIGKVARSARNRSREANAFKSRQMRADGVRPRARVAA